MARAEVFAGIFGIIKAVEVEAGLALPLDATIKVSKADSLYSGKLPPSKIIDGFLMSPEIFLMS